MAGPYVRKAAERHLSDLKRKDLDWRREQAELACDFFSEILVLEDGRPFVLEPFQAFIVGSCFGWYMRDGRRRFRTAYVETGKGNGKTPLAAGIGLYGLVADGEPAPEVYSAATAKDQAQIAWKDAWRMVKASPELDALILSPDRGDVQIGSLVIPSRNASFKPVSSEHRGLDGKRPHIAIIDELHEHPTSIVVDKMRAGTKRRQRALIFEITNAGWDRTSVCWHHHELSVKVLEGTLQNDQWFAYVCALDEGDEWTDEKVWPKANPGLGTILPISYLREQVEEAAGMPSKENIVKRLNACVWTEQADRWLDMALWDACPSAPIDIAAVEGRPCMAGLDGAASRDLFAFVMVFGPDEEDFLDVLARFWLPRATLEAKDSGRSEEARLRLVEWAREGWITATEGDTTDYDRVESDILADLARVQLQRLSFDRWGVTQLVTHLKDALGKERVVDFPQTMSAMSAPSKELEKLLRDGKLRHGGNPVLRWMASNVAIVEGRDGQIKPEREKSGDKIDGIVGLIMGIDGVIRLPAKRPSIYDERVARGEPVLTRI
jgi:phage terminase large subunit-like protein